MARSNNTASTGTVVEPKADAKIGKATAFDHMLVACTSDKAKELGAAAAMGVALGAGVVFGTWVAGKVFS